MAVVMYERVGHEGRRPSPFSWRVRYALAHKGVAAKFRPTRFADVETIRRLSGQHMVPVVVEGDTVVSDSWRIASWLEDRFPDRPSLFGGPVGRATTRALNIWSDTVLAPLLRPVIYTDFLACLAPEDRDYFRRSREAMLGAALEEACRDRPRHLAAFRRAAEPLERLLAEQPFVCGEAPRYADYVVFSVFQMARLGSPQDVLAAGSALAAWRSRMLALHDGLADAFPGHPDAPPRQ